MVSTISHTTLPPSTETIMRKIEFLELRHQKNLSPFSQFHFTKGHIIIERLSHRADRPSRSLHRTNGVKPSRDLWSTSLRLPCPLFAFFYLLLGCPYFFFHFYSLRILSLSHPSRKCFRGCS